MKPTKMPPPLTLRIPEEMKKRIGAAQQGLKMTEAEAIRLIIDFGLRDLESINFDIYGAVKNPKKHQ